MNIKNTPNFIVPFDSPSDEMLSELMSTIDIACQLRPKPHGEASGTIAQLLIKKKPIITTAGFVCDYPNLKIKEISADVTASELADVFQNMLADPDTYKSSDENLKNWTFDNFIKRFKDTIYAHSTDN